MERTELREQFFAEALRNPYMQMVEHLYAQAWADGYREALREAAEELDEVGTYGSVVVERLRHRHTLAELEQKGIARATEEGRKAEAEKIVALGQIGAKLGA